MARSARVLPLLALFVSAGVALVAPGSAAARMRPPGAAFKVLVVDRMSDATFKMLAERGAVGLDAARANGPTTNRRRALAQLVRGAEVNARLGGVPEGKPLINANKAAVFRDCRMCIVVKLPPRGRPFANHRLYRIAVIGRGFSGVLTSRTTRIPACLDRGRRADGSRPGGSRYVVDSVERPGGPSRPSRCTDPR